MSDAGSEPAASPPTLPTEVPAAERGVSQDAIAEAQRMIRYGDYAGATRVLRELAANVGSARDEDGLPWGGGEVTEATVNHALAVLTRVVVAERSVSLRRLADPLAAGALDRRELDGQVGILAALLSTLFPEGVVVDRHLTADDLLTHYTKVENYWNERADELARTADEAEEFGTRNQEQIEEVRAQAAEASQNSGKQGEHRANLENLVNPGTEKDADPATEETDEPTPGLADETPTPVSPRHGLIAAAVVAAVAGAAAGTFAVLGWPVGHWRPVVSGWSQLVRRRSASSRR